MRGATLRTCLFVHAVLMQGESKNWDARLHPPSLNAVPVARRRKFQSVAEEPRVVCKWPGSIRPSITNPSPVTLCALVKYRMATRGPQGTIMSIDRFPFLERIVHVEQRTQDVMGLGNLH